jgi:hypothetical protein
MMYVLGVTEDRHMSAAPVFSFCYTSGEWKEENRQRHRGGTVKNFFLSHHLLSVCRIDLHGTNKKYNINSELASGMLLAD